MKYIHLFFAILLVVLTFIFSIFVAIIPAAIMKLFKRRLSAEKWMRVNGTLIAKTIVWSLNMKLVVEGQEKIPPQGTPVCYVANHQSMLDIPVVIAGLHVWAGFITKQELKKVPILSNWIKAMQCVYIDRSSGRSSIEAILKGVENIKNGVRMFIFPEGTRSKTGQLGQFKSGSLKLATRSKAVIVPITIEGTRQGVKEKKGFRRVIVHLSVSDPIETASLDAEELKALPGRVYSAIEQQFTSYQGDS
ncbi:MAG: lysophospholipid acyltransferase family protein [Sphaerochaetaceae bacterium]